jgi:hypothetical protein
LPFPSAVPPWPGLFAGQPFRGPALPQLSVARLAPASPRPSPSVTSAPASPRPSFSAVPPPGPKPSATHGNSS